MDIQSSNRPEQTESPPPEGMEYCQITGKLTPSDEIVDLRGYRVCAEGKLEILRRLRAGLAMPGELETSSLGARIVAFLTDSFIIWTFAFIIGLAIGYNNIMENSALGSAALFDEEKPLSAEQLSRIRTESALNLFFYLASMAYFAVMHGMSGQTIGKKAAKIKVVNSDGSPISYRRAALRALFYQGPFLLTSIAFILPQDSVGLLFLGGGVAIVSGLWGLTNVLLALLDRAEQKALHDRLASTRVVTAA